MQDPENWERWTIRMREVCTMAVACAPNGWTSGPLHIILDDPNWQRHHIEWAIKTLSSGEWPEEIDLLRGVDYSAGMGITLCQALLDLTDDERREVLGWTAENGYETDEEELERQRMLAEPCLFPIVADDKASTVSHPKYLSREGFPVWMPKGEAILWIERPHVPISETELDLAECVPFRS